MALLKDEADPNVTVNGLPAVVFAAMNGETAVVKALLEGGTDPNARPAPPVAETTALHAAAANRDRKTFEVLVAGGAIPTQISGSLETPPSFLFFFFFSGLRRYRRRDAVSRVPRNGRRSLP